MGRVDGVRGQLASSEVEQQIAGDIYTRQARGIRGATLAHTFGECGVVLCPVLNRVLLSGAGEKNDEELSTMAAAAQALCSVMHEMDEQYIQHPLCQYPLAAAHVGLLLSDASRDNQATSEEVFLSCEPGPGSASLVPAEFHGHVTTSVTAANWVSGSG